MPRALPQPCREQIIQRWQQGHPLVQIARELRVPYRTVRDRCRRYRLEGAAALTPRYDRCARPGPRFPAAVVERALALKREHPRWGGGLIRLQLAQAFPDQPLPAPRTVQAWWAQAGLQPMRAQRPPVRRDRAQQPHEVWEIDAKERMRLADGSGTSVLTVTDEATGALLGLVAFPPVSLEAGPGYPRPGGARSSLHAVGKPERIRVDNGDPWATWADTPTALALWWVGWGIQPLWNHPGRPTENARVERCNGLIAAWGEPERCPNAAVWQQRVDWVAQQQREVYPACAGQSRIAAHPALRQNPRCYGEPGAAPFRLAQVQAYLAQGRWPRWVSKIGQITLYGQPYRVGRTWHGQHLWVRFAPETHEWVLQSADGTEVTRHPARQISTATILGLRVAHPRPPKKKRQKYPAPGPP